MASKVLKVKLWDGEDGKKWKNNVQDIEGEVLCGKSSPSSPFPFPRHAHPTIRVAI